MVAGIIVGKNVLRDLVPLPVVSQLFGTVIKKPENQHNEQDKLADIKQRGSMNLAPDKSVGRVSIANHGCVILKSFCEFALIFQFQVLIQGYYEDWLNIVHK